MSVGSKRNKLMKLEVNQISTKQSKDGITTMGHERRRRRMSLFGIGDVVLSGAEPPARGPLLNYRMSLVFFLFFSLEKNVRTKSCPGRSRVTRALPLSPLPRHSVSPGLMSMALNTAEKCKGKSVMWCLTLSGCVVMYQNRQCNMHLIDTFAT